MRACTKSRDIGRSWGMRCAAACRRSRTASLKKSTRRHPKEKRGLTSERKIEANRANARGSTGPKTGAGRARATRNALRHGLSLPVCSDPALSEEVEALAREIAGADANAERNERQRRQQRQRELPRDLAP